MAKLFGTDGIRDVASSGIFQGQQLCTLSKAIAHFVQLKNPNRQSTILIGLDGRFSGPSIQEWLIHWLTINNIIIVVCQDDNLSTENYSLAEKTGLLTPNTKITTPLLAHMVKKYYDFGIMITASHNPYTYNGLKFFNHDGEKLSVDEEKNIEDLFENPKEIEPQKILNSSGNVLERKILKLDDRELEIYEKNFNFDKLKIVIDCANGATSSFVNKIFKNKNNIIINDKPNGYNINVSCGSEYPEYLANEVIKNNANIGIAFDGDGDRLVVVDELGNILTGDHILAICAKFLMDNGKLKNNTIVVTSMSNLALVSEMKKIGISVVITDVGDRNVLFKMKETGSILGGENSGHIIFKNYASCGDGILSALILLDIINKCNKSLSDLSSIITPYPQVLINLPVKSKPALESFKTLKKLIKNAENDFNDNGRVLIRYSGTESICRIMVEGKNNDMVHFHANILLDELMSLIGL